MRSLLSPTACFGISPAVVRPWFPLSLHQRRFARPSLSFNSQVSASNPISSLKSSIADTSSSGRWELSPPLLRSRSIFGSNFAASGTASSSPAFPASISADDEADKAKLDQVTKRLEKTSRYFKRLGSLGFWGQLVCSVVASVILSFSLVITGKPTSPATFYATGSGIAAAFISVFWSFGYIRLSERLRRAATDPSKAPPRADVVRGLKSGITVNLLGMGAAILGMLATVGVLVAKALTTSASPFNQGGSLGYSPVLALDVFLVQASANTILSHFLGLICSLELLRSVTLPTSQPVSLPNLA